MYSKKLIFWSACLGMLIFGIGLITLGSVAPDLKAKLHLDEVASGTLFSILPFGILTGSLIFGPIADRYGFKILLTLSAVLMSAGFEGIALTESPWILKICILLIGLGGGIINGTSSAMVSDISDKDKGANLSLMGIFFGIGALGMPLILGILNKRLPFETIIAATGLVIFLAGIFFTIVRYPPAKQTHDTPFTGIGRIFRDRVLILIAFFLFFQSSFEGIINNWTTLYLTEHMQIQQSTALFALTAYIIGMVVMRLIIGTILRKVPVSKILLVSFGLILAGLIILMSGTTSLTSAAGLFLTGAGLAGGFPIMMGFAGDLYAELSGTVFSFVLVVALTGNMLINYAMGIISKNFGISHLTTVAFIETSIMIILSLVIIRKLKITR
jgi:MFS family permease